MRHPRPGTRLSTLITMSANAELSRIFKEMAVVLELTGANPFRVNAHTRVARAMSDLKVDVAEVTRAAEDVFLLCSDGLSDMLEEAAIFELCRGVSHDGLAELGGRLVQAANDAGGADNITVVLVSG